MEELKKLIDVIERKGKLSSSALLNYADGSSLETKLYQLIKNDEATDESLLINRLYGRSDRQNAYKMLKVRVKRKLHNQLFFLDTENKKIVDNLVTMEVKCRRSLYLAEVLLKLQEPALAKQQLNKTLLIAKEACLVKYEIDTLELQRTFFAERSYDLKSYENTSHRLQELYSIQAIEREADRVYFYVRFGSKFGVEVSKQFLETLRDEVEKLKKYWLITDSNHIFKRYHQLTMYYYEFTGEFELFVKYLNEIFGLYNAGKIHKAYFSVTFNKYMLIFALLRAKQYAEGLAEAESLNKELAENSANWFANMENYFLLALHSRNYRKAEDILRTTLQNKYLSETTTFAQERWLLFYKFTNYITGFSINDYVPKKLKYVSQDKKGYNVWNLILDFALALDKREPELVEREADRLRKFSAKYLTSKEDARTTIFLKLLLLISRNFDDIVSCKRKSAYLLNKLKITPTGGIAYAETEIIPYEDLWEIILLKLSGSK